MSATPYYSDDHVTIWHGDCREVNAWLEAWAAGIDGAEDVWCQVLHPSEVGE